MKASRSPEMFMEGTVYKDFKNVVSFAPSHINAVKKINGRSNALML